MSDARNFHQGAAEHLVLGECLRRHIEAYLAHGSQPGWDVRTFDSVSSCSRRISVKAVDWPDRSAVQFSKSQETFDVAVIVLLSRSEAHPKFLIASKEDVERCLSAKNPDRKDTKRTLTMSQALIDAWEPLDRWESHVRPKPQPSAPSSP